MEFTVGSAKRNSLSHVNRSVSYNAHLFNPAVSVVQKSDPGGPYGDQVLCREFSKLHMPETEVLISACAAPLDFI